MPGSKKGHKQGSWDEHSMKLAVRDVLMYNKSQESAATQYGISRETLRRHLAKSAKGEGLQKKLGRKPVMTDDQEHELSSYLQTMEASLYGLTPASVRRLVYKFCEENGILHPFKRETQSAGKKWFRQFMARHSELSVRSAEPVSIQRAIGFNEPKVNMFLDIPEKAVFMDQSGAKRIPPENI